MKTNIDIMVVQTNKAGTDDISYSLRGRLLGACNEMEATKIVTNWPVAERILTGGTSTLKESVEIMKEIHKEEGEKGFGHLVVALSALSRTEQPSVLETLTKQLFISPPVVLFAEEPNSKINEFFSVNLECADGSIITMEECNDE